MKQTIAHLDCSAGISETVLLASLLDLGFPLALLEQALAPMRLLQGYQLQYTACCENGVPGSRFSVLHAVSQTTDLNSAAIQGLLASSSLSPHIQQQVLKVCNCLVDAKVQIEGKIGIEVDNCSVGDTDAIIALIGIVLGLDFLGITQMYAGPLPLANGSIQTEQGLLPTVPPVTLEILRRVAAPWRPCASQVELVTPLGAAILATLARFESPPLYIERVGYGFAQRELAPPGRDKPGSVRLCLGQRYIEQEAEQEGEQEASVMPHQGSSVGTVAAESAETDWITVIESHIDNMSGELLGGLMERLFSAGALDVSYTPIQMKKNRPATLLTMLCPPEIGEQLALFVLRETTTLGVRIQQVRRLKAQRYQTTISTSLGPILVKVKRLGSRIVSAAPEYEECQRIASEHNMPLIEVYEVVRAEMQNISD